MTLPEDKRDQPAQSTGTPIVSVCIPSFNAEGTIVQCLDSVLAQDLGNAEILLVDNCSTDRTVELAAATLESFPNTRIVRNDSNIGRVPNWNRCVDLARGEYLKFAFTNDALLPGALTCLIEAMESEPGTVMVGSRQLTVERMPDTLPPMPASCPRETMDSREALKFFARNGFMAAGSLNGMLYRRSVMLEHRLRFDEDIPYFADFIHALEMAVRGKTVLLDVESHCFNVGATHRYHNIGQKNPSEYLAEHRECTVRHMRLLEQQGCDGQPALDYLLGRYYWYLGQGWNLSARDAVRTFSGFPRHQFSTAARTLWYQTRQKLQAAH